MSKATPADRFTAGVIEGFFGNAWSWQARADCVRFLRRAGFGFYIYAPKSDAFLRRRWREPIPAALQESMSLLSLQCHEQGLAFGVGLSPFEVYRDYDAAAREDLHRKVLQLNRIGVDALCILFDDMRGDIAGLAGLQARIVADIAAWSDASRLIFCPTYYSFDPLLERVFGPKPAGYLEDLSRLLDPRIDFFWTGEQVCSTSYSARHLDEVACILGRQPFIWDNNVSNDAKLRCQRLFLTPDASGWTLPTDHAAGLAINPMNQAYLSQVALCAYARVLGLRAGDAGSTADCFDLGGPALRSRLLEDLSLFQTAGLGQIDGDLRESLSATYRSLLPNPIASDILAWLGGEYAFDPACLTE